VLVTNVVFHEHYFDFKVSVASPINCDVGVLVSLLNLVYNEHIRDVSLKIHRVFLFLLLNILMLALVKVGLEVVAMG
jgi:hypothetical protein